MSRFVRSIPGISVSLTSYPKAPSEKALFLLPCDPYRHIGLHLRLRPSECPASAGVSLAFRIRSLRLQSVRVEGAYQRVRIYFDIETSRTVPTKWLGEIQMVGLITDQWAYGDSNADRVNEVTILSREHLSEEDLLRKTWDYLLDSKLKRRARELVGFNIFRFDIPFLMIRSDRLQVKSFEESFEELMFFIVQDLRQPILAGNDFFSRGTSLKSILERAKAEGFGPPEPYGAGARINDLVQKGDWPAVEKHLRADLEATRWLHMKGIHLLLEKASQSDRKHYFDDEVSEK